MLQLPQGFGEGVKERSRKYGEGEEGFVCKHGYSRCARESSCFEGDVVSKLK
jgi:hypothetical protein